MPELPEVETSRRGIAPHILSVKVKQVVVRQRQLRWPVTATLDELVGQVITRVRRRGKYILLDTAKGSAIIHLGMSGSLRVVDSRSEVIKHDHIDLVLANKKILRFNDPRRFGAFLWTHADPLAHPLLAALGPEPLTRAFTADYLATKISNRKQAIKLAIMDSKVVVGVGNIYANEALFYAGIRPQAMANTVNVVRLEQLVVAIQQVLRLAIKQGGTTLRNFVNPQGTPGYFKQVLAVYDRAGLPCIECQKPLSHMLIGQRATYYCGHCQR